MCSVRLGSVRRSPPGLEVRPMSATSVRALDRGTPPERFARGWHCLGLAKDFRDGTPHAVEALGGDLTQGTVKGDEIACPFHDWRWGGDGRCKAIPYARRVPLRARTQKYPSAIVNGQVMIWHDVEGSEPDLAVLPPEL